jgi:hypothetical protein
MWLRIAAISNIAYVRGVPQAFYRVHQASMLRMYFRSKLADLQHLNAAFDGFFLHCSDQLRNDGDRLHALARRALACEALWEACRAYDRNELVEAEAAELIRFSLQVCPAATQHSLYRALRRRQRLGAVICNHTQLFAGSAIVHRIRHWLRRERWKRQGI